MFNRNLTPPEIEVPLPGESESPLLYQTCLDDIIVEETEWPDKEVVSAVGPSGDGPADLWATAYVAGESPPDLPRLSAEAIRWSRSPNFERSSRFTPRRLRSGCREFVDEEGWPGMADTYESDKEEASDSVADDATFATPQKTADVEDEDGDQLTYVYDLNGVAIDMSGVHPWAHKLLLAQYRSEDFGKLPPKEIMEMWKDWFPV